MSVSLINGHEDNDMREMDIMGKDNNDTIRDAENIIKRIEEDRELRRNASGCYDPTAYVAITRADTEAEYTRFKKLLDIIYKLCDLCDFEIREHIVLKDKKTGKVWR